MTKTHLNQSKLLLLCYVTLSFLPVLPQSTLANTKGCAKINYKAFLAVSGKVTSTSDQQPLSGVSVTIKGTNIGTTTDDAGNYRFNNVENNATLVFSFVGYQTVEAPVRGRPTIDIALQPEAGMLVETIVTANAIRRDKRSLGYSAPVVRSDELLTGRNSSPLNALQGKVAGVNITS
ncbi:MAG TPA: carboxypeptidase-like regulatory domain-containing protein, partial [Niastella sp.]